jgi:hypothetical protein
LSAVSAPPTDVIAVPAPLTDIVTAMQHQGLSPLLRLLNSSSTSVQYNAAFALYELSEARKHGLLMHQAGGLQHLYVCSHRLQVGWLPGAAGWRGGAWWSRVGA